MLNRFINKQNGLNAIPNVLTHVKSGNQLLPDVPNGKAFRSERYGSPEKGERRSPSGSLPYHDGVRFEASFPVKAYCWQDAGKPVCVACTSEDISTKGIRLRVDEPDARIILADARRIELRFRIPPGAMPEGYEKRVKMDATVNPSGGEDGLCDLEFAKPLPEHIYRKNGMSLRYLSLLLLLLLMLTVVLMRVESVLYFRFNRLIYFYSIITAFYLLSRYFLSSMYKPVPVNVQFTPSVSIIVPCFNEEEWIERTILGCVNQDYPINKLEVIVIDDCSIDDSYQKIRQIARRLRSEYPQLKLKKRLRYLRQPHNAGKREAMAAGVRLARNELVVFVDSDSFLDPQAVRHLVQPFQDPKMGGVTGRTDVANTYTNTLTKMQSVRYYIAFRVMKAAESCFDAVTCLSGPISCYRKTIVLEHMDEWLTQSFWGHKATFGDDRSMTNFVLRNHRTAYQDTAVCSTIVPNEYSQFFKQQMRWKRSWLRESTIAAQFMWQKEPLMALTFYMGFLIPILAPVIMLFNVFYVPLTMHVVPLTFILGMTIMSLMMSVAHLYFRRSSNWLYGMLFCLFYCGVLLWQMPIAWVTFWKSTWGTRMTPQDIEAEEQSQMRSRQWQQVWADGPAGAIENHDSWGDEPARPVTLMDKAGGVHAAK